MTLLQYDIVIVGGGPAGLGAAIEAGRSGAKVLLIDENQQPGGQLFKQIHKFFGSRDHYAGTRGFEIGRILLKEAEKANVEIRLNTRVFGYFPDGTIAACTDRESFRCWSKYIILATGAVENSLAFRGNTLPGVITAGACQTMINLRHVRPGKRAVVVGSGNVGLIVTYQMLQAGMEVAAILEAAPFVSGYAVHAAKVRRGGVPILLSHTVLEARGDGELSGIIATEVDEQFRPIAGSEQLIEADTLCIAVGMSPRMELAKIAGCKMVFNGPLGGLLPVHDETLRTSNGRILIAGDLSGIEEASTALDEGRLAGTNAAVLLGLCPKEEGEKKLKEIQERIHALRAGQFGEKRQTGKEQIWREYRSGKEMVNTNY